MSQIDLKHATIYIRDGYAGVAAVASMAVDNVAGYPLGTVTMLVDGATGSVAVGDVFTVAGDDIRHRITAHSETLAATTSVTFTPGLGAAVVDGAAFTWQPHELEVDIGEGTFTYSEKRNIEYKKSRGKLKTVREGDEEPVDVRIDAVWEFLRSVSGATTPTIEEALKKIGAASEWVSTDPDACQPYAVDIVVEYIPPCSGVQSETITIGDYRWESLEHDAKAGTINTSGKANVTQATVVRAA